MTLFQFPISNITFQHCVHSFTPAGLSEAWQDGGLELLLCQFQPQWPRGLRTKVFAEEVRITTLQLGLTRESRLYRIGFVSTPSAMA